MYGLLLKECLLVTIMNVGKKMKYLYEGGCIGNEAGKLLELKVAIVELEPWRVSMKADTKLVCLVLPDSKNKAASCFGIRV